MKNEGVEWGVGETGAKGNSDFDSTLVATTTCRSSQFGQHRYLDHLCLWHCSVFQTLAASETEFSTIYEDCRRKEVCRSSTLAMQAGAWDHYGHRWGA